LFSQTKILTTNRKGAHCTERSFSEIEKLLANNTARLVSMATCEG